MSKSLEVGLKEDYVVEIYALARWLGMQHVDAHATAAHDTEEVFDAIIMILAVLEFCLSLILKSISLFLLVLVHIKGQPFN